MPKRWQDDTALVDGLAGNLMELLSIFPKRMIHVDELVHTYGMPLSHIQILILLSEGPLSVGQLSERMGVAKPNMTPLIDSLRDAGLVQRVRSGLDKRVVSVDLLPKGKATLDSIRLDVARQIAAWPGSLSRSEAKELNAAAGSMIRLAKTAKEESTSATINR